MIIDLIAKVSHRTMKQNVLNTSVTGSMAKAHLFEAPTDSKLNKLVKGNPNEKLNYEFIVHPMSIILKPQNPADNLYIATECTSTFCLTATRTYDETSKVDEQQTVCPNTVMTVTTI